MLSFSLLNTGLDSLWVVWLHYFLQMSLKEYLAASVLEIGVLHATCYSPVYDVRLLMQELVSNNNKKEATEKSVPSLIVC